MGWIWLLLLIPPVLWFALRRWRGARRTSRDGRAPLDPKVRVALEDEVRRRQDGSGPTVAGGQHLG